MVKQSLIFHSEQEQGALPVGKRSSGQLKETGYHSLLLIFISVGPEMVDLIGKAMNFTSDIGSNFFSKTIFLSSILYSLLQPLSCSLFQCMDVLEQLYASGKIYDFSTIICGSHVF